MDKVLFIAIIVWVTGCSNNIDSNDHTNNPPFAIPVGFDTPVFPDKNEVTDAKIALGKALFFETRLSKNNNISCASCHNPKLAFADTIPLSIGTNGELGFRNSPSIINLAYKNHFHKDGGIENLELQVLAPIIDTNELGQDFTVIMDYLSTNEVYIKLFKAAFDTLPTIYGLTRAIATFERSLVFGNSAYDSFLNGDSAAFTSSQKRGLALFESDRLNCAECHTGRLLTNNSFQNIGLAHQFADSGRARITFNPSDAGKFVVPSLRNVAITPPYMHDGSVSSLLEVIQLFEKGVGNHPNKSQLIHPFELTQQERTDLLHFLEGLTDEAFKKN